MIAIDLSVRRDVYGDDHIRNAFSITPGFRHSGPFRAECTLRMITCHQCGYSREGLTDDRPCPECGTMRPVSAGRIEGRALRRWWLLPVVILGCGLAVDLLSGLVVPLLHLLWNGYQQRMPGISFIGAGVCCFAGPCAAVIGAIGYAFRLGPAEVWQIEGDRFVVRSADSNELVESWPLVAVEFLQRWAASPIARTVDVMLVGRSRPARSLHATLPMEVLLATRDEIVRRCNEARRVGDATDGVRAGTAAATAAADIEPRVAAEFDGGFINALRVSCTNCSIPRPLAKAHDACACGLAGWPREWRVIRVASHRLVPSASEERTRAREAGPDFLRLPLPTSPIVIVAVVLVAFIGSRPFVPSSPSPNLVASVWLLIAFPFAALALGTLMYAAPGTSGVIVVRPDRIDFVTPSNSRMGTSTSLPRDQLTRASGRLLTIETPKGELRLWLSRTALDQLQESLTPTHTSPGGSQGEHRAG